MSVMGLLQRSVRLQQKPVASCLFQLRALTGAEAVNALRPLYFAVHPDFFGQYPRERAVNENSLQRLNGYLEKLEQPGSPPPPMELSFYVRKTNPLTSGFRSVRFTLSSKDVVTTVVNVLTSCSLPVQHMKATPTRPQGAAASNRPIRWNKSYYNFTGFRDPEEEVQQARSVERTLSSWLSNNEPKATHKLSESLPRRAELSRLRAELCHRFHLKDIRWQRNWGVAHQCSQLRSLSRLCQQSPETLINLKGHTVVFADQSEMNSSGHVMLGTTDVHQQWIKLFQQLPSYSNLHQQGEQLKERISFLLGGAQVVDLEGAGPSQNLAHHYHSLSHFHRRLIDRPLRLHPRSLMDLRVTLDSDRTSPSLHPTGHFLIPPHCDLSTLQTFLQSHAHQARVMSQRRKQLLEEEKSVVARCVQSLSLSSLVKESSVSPVQMLGCCQRLMEQRPPLLTGLPLRVTHYYSVLQDGDLCVPWNWKS